MTGTESLRYVVITPVKDEAKYIGETLESVCLQTQKPCQWLIVDDGSKDETAEIVKRYASNNGWIKVVPLTRSSGRYPGSPVISAFKYALDLVDKDKFDYIVKLDGDLRLPPDYFEKILERFREDPALGIASGVYLELVHEAWQVVTMPAYHAAGASKVVRKECFLQIGGFVPSLGWDTIDEIKARVKGWRTAHFADIPFYHLKNEGTGIGKLRTSMVHGRIFYLTGGKPLFFMMKTLKRMLLGKPVLVSGVLMLWGYLKAVLAREARLVTAEEAALYNSLLSERVSSKAKGLFS